MKVGLVPFLLAFSFMTWGQDKNTNAEEGVGIQGHDPVAYFTKNHAVKGEKSITEIYDGVTYYFSSHENKLLFKKTPLAYLPAYGGWCAYAMADGEKVKIDPETFKIIDGRLYLFYNFYFNNTLVKWNKDEKSLRTKADQHWNQINK